jgi:hypothetical protein
MIELIKLCIACFAFSMLGSFWADYSDNREKYTGFWKWFDSCTRLKSLEIMELVWEIEDLKNQLTELKNE